MSNSPLVSHVHISPNRNAPRQCSISRITPHCVVGQASVESLGNLFGNPGREASSNYGIGYDGRVGMYCPESDRSWCSSSPYNDHRAVTIECASDNYHPYAVNGVVWNKLIELCVDICRRNGKNKLVFLGHDNYNPAGNEMLLTAHRWYASTICPGDYLYSRFPTLAAEVTRRLGGAPARDYLQKGDSGSAVKTMQTMLIDLGFSCGKAGVDGHFGDDTLAAVKAMQKAYGLSVDGLYGPKSKAALTAAYNKKHPELNVKVSALAYDTVRKGWLPIVTSGKGGAADTIGLPGHACGGFAVNAPDQKLTYAVHTNGRWLPEVNGYNVNDFNNGFAGNYTPIDGVIIKGKGIAYQVKLKGSQRWLPVVYSDNANYGNSDAGYAGIFGQIIDEIKIWRS